MLSLLGSNEQLAGSPGCVRAHGRICGSGRGEPLAPSHGAPRRPAAREGCAEPRHVGLGKCSGRDLLAVCMECRSLSNYQYHGPRLL